MKLSVINRVLNHFTQNVFMAGYDNMCTSRLLTLELAMIAGLASAALTVVLILISNNFLSESNTAETLVVGVTAHLQHDGGDSVSPCLSLD